MGCRVCVCVDADTDTDVDVDVDVGDGWEYGGGVQFARCKTQPQKQTSHFRVDTIFIGCFDNILLVSNTTSLTLHTVIWNQASHWAGMYMWLLLLVASTAQEDPRATLQRAILTGVDDTILGAMMVAEPASVHPITVSASTSGGGFSVYRFLILFPPYPSVAPNPRWPSREFTVSHLR